MPHASIRPLARQARRAVALWALGACLPAAAGIANVAGLEAVRVWEATYSLAHPVSFAPGDPRLTQRLDGAALSQAGRDFGFFDGNENYDLYFSDADGTLNPQGRFLTIDGNCDVPLACFNITEVALRVNGQDWLANAVVRAVYGGGPQTANSHLAAADGNFATYTALGDTMADQPNGRMSITLAFANVPAIPEPQSVALLALGLATLGLRGRRSRAGR